MTLGSDVVVGEASVLDIDTSMGDGAQLGHASSLQAGQSVPAGERRHGFAAQELTEVDYGGVEPLPCGTARKVAYSVLQLLGLVAVRAAAGGRRRGVLVLSAVPALAVSTVFFAGSILGGLASS